MINNEFDAPRTTCHRVRPRFGPSADWCLSLVVGSRKLWSNGRSRWIREPRQLCEQPVEAVEHRGRIPRGSQIVELRDRTPEPSRCDKFVFVRPLLEVTRFDEPD
jgi:hypothetical protein